MSDVDPNAACVVIQQLVHGYSGGRRRPPRSALNGLDLVVPRGVFFVLTGPNGSGKSSLFKILCGMIRPASGAVRIMGHDLLQHPHAARQLMGVVFQKPALDKQLSVEENLRIHAELHAIPGALFRQRLEASLAWSDLQGRLADRVGELSGGLARQAELVKVLLHEPQLLILDEPTTGLDPGGRLAFLATLKRLQQKRGVTILMTSHIFAEAERADLVAILRQGQLLAMAPPQTLSRRLGAEILVIQADDLESIARGLGEHDGVQWQIQNHELRIQAPDVVALMAELHQRYREGIQTLAIRHPTLEDYYIHLTGRALAVDEEEGG